MSDHKHHDHPHDAPETHDASAQALSEALSSSFVIVKIAMVALVVIIFAAGFFRVGSTEKAVILRFGKPQGEGQQMLLGAGLHWSLPYPIDEVVRIPTTENQIIKSTIGWYATTPDMEAAGTEPAPGPSLNPLIDGYVITADRNIVHARATVSYSIDDPLTAIFKFTSGTNHQFNLAGISNAIQNAANNALVSTAARFNVDDILINRREEFRDAVLYRIIELTDSEHLGVEIKKSIIVDSIPPRQLKDVFDSVVAARQNYEKLKADALGDQTRILSQADATASSITNAAESARTRYVTSIQSDAAAFSQLLPKYENNPRLFAQLQLTKAMTTILANVGEKKMLPTHANGKPVELRLNLGNELPQKKSDANP